MKRNERAKSLTIKTDAEMAVQSASSETEDSSKKTDEFDSVTRRLLETQGNVETKKRFMGILRRYTNEMTNAAATPSTSMHNELDVNITSVHAEIMDEDESILFGIDIPLHILKNESNLFCGGNQQQRSSAANIGTTFVQMFENTIIPELNKLKFTDDQSTTIKIRSVSIQKQTTSSESSDQSPEQSMGKY